MKKKVLSMVLAGSLAVSLSPAAALAADKVEVNTGELTKISVDVPASAIKTDEVVSFNIVPVEAVNNSDEAVEIAITLPDGGAKVEIPVENVTYGTVAVRVNEDDSEEYIKTTAISDKGVVLDLAGSATVKIINNNKYFSDVHDVNHWAINAVDFVSARGLYDGTGMNHFSPDEDMTRGMVATVLYRLENSPAYTTEQSFSDVAADAWYADGLYWAVENGLFAGYGNGISGAEDSITREQLAVMLYRYAQYKGYDTTQGGMAVREFADYDDISGYARSSMQWAVNAQIISGYNNLLSPQDSATRAQVATMLMNFIQGLY